MGRVLTQHAQSAATPPLAARRVTIGQVLRSLCLRRMLPFLLPNVVVSAAVILASCSSGSGAHQSNEPSITPLAPLADDRAGSVALGSR